MNKSIKTLLIAIMTSSSLLFSATAVQAAPRLKMSPVIPALTDKNVRDTVLFAYQHDAVFHGYVNSKMTPVRSAISNVALDSRFVQMRRITCTVGGSTCPIYAGTLKGAIVQSKAYNGKRVRAYNVQVSDSFGTHTLIFAKNGALLSGAKKDKKAARRTISQGAFSTTGVVRYLVQSCNGATSGNSTPYAKFAEQPIALSSSTGGHGQFRRAIDALQASNPSATAPVSCGSPTPNPGSTPTPQPTTPAPAPTCDQANWGVIVTFDGFTAQKDQKINAEAKPVGLTGDTLLSVDWYWGDGTSKETTTSLNSSHIYVNQTKDWTIAAEVHYASGASVVCKGIFREKREP